MKARYWFIPLFALMPVVAQDEKPSKDAVVWAIDDTEKIHPISGDRLSDGADVYEGRRASTRDFRTRNGIWDAATQTVKLFAGRNEFVSFQVVIEKKQDDLHKVFVNLTDLIGTRDRISADSHIRLFKQHYLTLDGVWYPDALIPFELAGATPLELPDAKESVGLEQKVQSVWVDVYVPHQLPPGTYTGQIMVLHRATNKQSVLNLQLEVGGFVLPDEMNLDVDLMNYGFLSIERGWPDMILDSTRHRAIEREFFRMAHSHRMTFAIVPYNHDGSIPKGLKPELSGVGEDVRVADWSSWDERFGPLLSGEAFSDLPRRSQPVNHFFLPYNLMWPSDIRNWQKPDYRTEHLRVSQSFREHFAEKGWTKPHYQIYYNHKEHYHFFPWNLDEPTREEDLAALEYLARIVDESFPSEDPVHLAFRLDIGHFHCENVPDCKHPRETGRVVMDRLGPLVDLWNIGSPHYWANLAAVRKLKQQGKITYFYNGTPVVKEPLLRAVFWGWQGFRYEADGICFWNATDWTDWDTDSAPDDPYTTAGGRYRGFSMVFYPGSRFGYDGPIPSLRLKALRRGMQDFEYLRLIEKSGRKTHEELVRMVEELVSGEGDYLRLRRALYEALDE